MRRYSNYHIFLIAVFLITMLSAGCMTGPAPVPAPVNRYNPGDVVSDKPTEGYGMVILKYDPAADVYIGRGVGRMEDGWVWLNNTSVAETRVSVEAVNIYKTGNISDLSVIGQL